MVVIAAAVLCLGPAAARAEPRVVDVVPRGGILLDASARFTEPAAAAREAEVLVTAMRIGLGASLEVVSEEEIGFGGGERRFIAGRGLRARFLDLPGA